MSQLTTHILDTSKGKPAAGITVILYYGQNDSWDEVARGITDADGRIPNFLPEELTLVPGIYKLRFETKDYFDRSNIPTFYPYVEIICDIWDKSHYHVPLLLSPFGFSTYRGS